MLYYQCCRCQESFTYLTGDGCEDCGGPCRILTTDRNSSISSNATAGSSNSDETDNDGQLPQLFAVETPALEFSSAFTKILESVELKQKSAAAHSDFEGTPVNLTAGTSIKQSTGALTKVTKDKSHLMLGADLQTHTEPLEPLEEPRKAASVVERTQDERGDREGNLQAKEKAQVQVPHEKSKSRKESRQKKKKLTALELRLQSIKEPVTKPMPKLPLPDPVPVSSPPATDAAWTEVVKKPRKDDQAWETVTASRKEVNKTPYETRKLHENEAPKPAVKVRFNIGGKHEAKFMLPRSTVED